MSERKCIFIIAALLVLTLTATSRSALADSHTGQISVYDLDGSIRPERGACVKTVPDLPGGRGWACLQKDNDLYQEITNLLRDALIHRLRCTIGWDTTDPQGHLLIAWVDCTPS